MHTHVLCYSGVPIPLLYVTLYLFLSFICVIFGCTCCCCFYCQSQKKPIVKYKWCLLRYLNIFGGYSLKPPFRLYLTYMESGSYDTSPMTQYPNHVQGSYQKMLWLSIINWHYLTILSQSLQTFYHCSPAECHGLGGANSTLHALHSLTAPQHSTGFCKRALMVHRGCNGRLGWDHSAVLKSRAQILSCWSWLKPVSLTGSPKMKPKPFEGPWSFRQRYTDRQVCVCACAFLWESFGMWKIFKTPKSCLKVKTLWFRLESGLSQVRLWFCYV